MKFSIVIPVYNVEEYLRACLDSVLRQSCTDYEIVLVDDGSTDASGNICDEYKRAHPKKITVVHQQNRGLISARRVGIQNARGEFCVFVDSDDEVEPDLLETVADYLSKDDEIDMVLYSFRYLRDGKKAERRVHIAEDGTIWAGAEKQQLYEKLIYTVEITSIWAKAIRTEILRQDPTPYEQYAHKNMAEDLLQSLYPLTAARKVCYADHALYNYRMNTSGISHRYTLEQTVKNDTRHVYAAIRKYLNVWGMDSAAYRQRLDATAFHGVMYQFSRCYETAKTGEERKRILRFDWSQMLPNVEIAGNEYISIPYARLFFALRRRRYSFIRFYFWKKKTIKRLRGKR